ncbi:MAG TPA: Wzz/FepE/Etk N-terminal domain-containing protein [Thermoanaerobaculales bacterium]|nr:Wzz/FepE/Etk N-terminal domain-containing protein [Thermoanaerobaculales bacterium]
MAAQEGLGGREWGTSLSLRDLLTVVFKRRWLIVAITAAAVAVAVSVCLLLPPSYEVAATLLVSRARAEVPLAPTDSTQAIAGAIDEKELNSEVEILRSRKLIEETLEIVARDGSRPGETEGGRSGEAGAGSPAVRSRFDRIRRSPADQTVAGVHASLDVTAIRKSNIIRVGLVSGDPEWATRFVQTLTERYIQQRVERYQSQQVVAFFEEQMRGAEARLRQSEEALEEFSGIAGFTITKGGPGTDSLASQKALILNRLAELRNELADAGTRVQELSSQIGNLTARLAQEPERLASPNRVFRGPEGEVIEQRLAELRLERDALLQDFKPDSRYVRDIDTQIQLAEARLAEVRAQVDTIDGTEANPLHQELKGELLRAEVERDATRARYRSLSEQVDRYQGNLDALNKNAFQLENLQREARAAEEEYLLYRKKVEEARISAAMDQQRLINVTVAEPAQPPLAPVGRGLTMVMVLALLGGLLGGLVAAFGTELYLDRSFTTGEDMERRIGLVHLASIPEEL